MNNCTECGAPIDDAVERVDSRDQQILPSQDRTICDVCCAMWEAIRRCAGLVAAHNDWEQENERLIAQKERLLHPKD